MSEGSPYRGLEPFDERDAPFFFGREREARLISASLFAAPLTLLYGASGVGKSSVLRAGVLPRLRARQDLLPVVFPTLATEGQGGTVVRGWQSDPVGGIKEATARALYTAARDDQAALSRIQDEVLKREMAPLQDFLAACHEVSGRRLMVILDQFEEYSLYHPEDDPFAEQFPAAVSPGDLSVSFLLSLREDSLAKLDRFKGRIPTLWDSYRRVDYLERSAAEDAIRLPLREYNRRQSTRIEVEDALVEAVLDEIQAEAVEFEATGAGTLEEGGGKGRIDTPYLQLVMTRLWERERAEGSAMLRASTLNAEGGSATIVKTHLDRVMEQFTPEEQNIAARVFHRLVTPSGAKIAFSVRDLAEYETLDADELAPVLRRLEEGSRRILRRVATRAEAHDEPRYEIFHDRLGKAILTWRAKRIAEQVRDERQRQEAEQLRVSESTRSVAEDNLAAVMEHLGGRGLALWTQIMFFLLRTDGRRLVRSTEELATWSEQPRQAVEDLVTELTTVGVLRRVEDGRYSIVDDVVADALLAWHSVYVTEQSFEVRPAAGLSRRFPFKSVRQRLYKGMVVPFLGSGASFSSKQGPPAYGELKKKIARDCGFPAMELESSAFSEVASFYVSRLGRPQLDALLQETFGRNDFVPSETHRFLAEVAKSAPLLILTTNYDTLMEQALGEAGVAYGAFAYVPGRKSWQLQAVQMTTVVRLHGPEIVGGRVTGSYALTEEDQIDWIAWLNSPEALPGEIGHQLRRSHLLSLGHSRATGRSGRCFVTFVTRGGQGEAPLPSRSTPPP